MNTQFRFPFPDREGYLSTGAPKASNSKIPPLFTPLTIRGVTFKNRIVVSPMCQYSSEDGFFNDYHLVHLGSFALGGASLIFTEATAVEDIGRISPYCPGIWKDEHIAPAKRIVDFIHANKAMVGIQIAHSGRKGSLVPPFHWKSKVKTKVPPNQGGWETVGPSPIEWSEDYTLPHELTRDEIKGIINKFVNAAKRAEQAGFDVLEIHGAHGYLISSFNSPTSNKRTDEYGGSFENRTRFCIEVTKAVREAWPTKPLFLRLSCSDWVEGGWDIEQTVRLAKSIKDLGVDVLDCSSGGNSPAQKIQDGPGYQVPFAEKVKKEVDGLLVGAVGKITNANQANEIIESGKADFVLLAREFLRTPNWPLKAASELGVDVDYPYQYERAKEK